MPGRRARRDAAPVSDPSPAPTTAADGFTLPRGRALLRVALLDLAAPVAVYHALRACGVGDLAALAAGALPPAAHAAVTAVRERRVEPVAVVVVLTTLVGLVAALTAGGPRDLLARGAWLTAPSGLWVLSTLWPAVWRGRPFCFLATRALLVHRSALMDRLWAGEPRFRRAWRQITAVWGLALLADSGLRVLMAHTLPVPVVPALDAVLTVGTAVVLQLPTHLLLHRSGCWRLLFASRRSGGGPGASSRGYGRQDREGRPHRAPETVATMDTDPTTAGPDRLDEAAWAEVLAQLRGYVRRRIADPHRADDLVGDIVLRIHHSLGTLDDRDRLAHWVGRIARNAVVDEYRRAARARELPVAAVDDAPAADADGDPAGSLAELAACLRPLLAGLSPEQRRAVELVDLDGWPQARAARHEGISVSGLKSRVQRGRRRLADLLGRCCTLTLDARGLPVEHTPTGSCGCGAEAQPQQVALTVPAQLAPHSEPAGPSGSAGSSSVTV